MVSILDIDPEGEQTEEGEEDTIKNTVRRDHTRRVR